MNAKLLAVIILVVAAITGASAYLFLRPPPPQPVAAHLMAPHAAVPAAPATAANTATAPSECLLPGPPPVPPDGVTATDADMKLGHDAMQNFVNELEAYQACRDAQADHAGPDVSQSDKQKLIDDGDRAIDEANALAHAFGVQLDAYHAKQKVPVRP